MCNTADNAQTFPQFPLSLHACFAEVRKHFWLYTIFTWGPTEQHKSLLPFLEEPTALVKPSSSLCCHKKVPSFWMQSAAVQRLCCGLGKKSALVYLPGRSSQGCWAEAGTSSSGEGHLWAERLPETLCFGFSSSETARLHNWSAAPCKDWKEQSVSAGKIKKSKHLRLHFLLHFQDTLLEDMKAGHPANKDRNETPTGTSQLGREKSPATELPEIGQHLQTHQPPEADSQLREVQQTDPSYTHGTRFLPGRDYSWSRASSQAGHARRCGISICEGSIHPCFTSLLGWGTAAPSPASTVWDFPSLPASQEPGKAAPQVRQLMLRSNVRHQIYCCCNWLQLHLPEGALLR